MLTVDRVAVVWMSNGIPVRLFWSGERYRVIDTPTPLSAEDLIASTWHPTHLPDWHGWRLTGRSEAGAVHTFDLRQWADDERWHVVGVYS